MNIQSNYILLFLGQLFLILFAAKVFNFIFVSWYIILLPILIPITIGSILLFYSVYKQIKDNKNVKG